MAAKNEHVVGAVMAGAAWSLFVLWRFVVDCVVADTAQVAGLQRAQLDRLVTQVQEHS